MAAPAYSWLTESKGPVPADAEEITQGLSTGYG